MKIILCTYHHGRDIEGIDIRRIFQIPGYASLDAGFSPYKFIADIFLFFIVLKTTWRVRPLILHGHLHEGALIGWAVKWCLFWRKISVIMDMQGSLTGELVSYGTLNRRQLLTKAVAYVERLICQMPAFFFCSSRESRATLIEQFQVDAGRCALLKDVVPDAFFNNCQQKNLKYQYNIPDVKKIILYTGSLLPGKGVQFVLEAIRILCSKRSDLFFVLAGYPRDTAEQFINEHDLVKYVLLPGQVSYSDLSKWLSVGDVALEPKADKSGEASGKLLHYMASGLAVVCFNTVNNRNILEKYGYYAETISSEAFSAAIEQAIEDGERAARRGKQGRSAIKKSYSMAAVGEQLATKYRQLIAGSYTL